MNDCTISNNSAVSGAGLYTGVETNLIANSTFNNNIASSYGGGFATIPAYLKDMFGVYEVSAIHGRLLTAWSTAGVLGPLLVNYTREYQLQLGSDKAGAYQTVLHIMAGLLVVGFIANLLVKPVAEKYWLPASKLKH